MDDRHLVASLRECSRQALDVYRIAPEVERWVKRRHHGEAQRSDSPRLDRERHRVGSSPTWAPIACAFSSALVVTKICTAGLTLG